MTEELTIDELHQKKRLLFVLTLTQLALILAACTQFFFESAPNLILLVSIFFVLYFVPYYFTYAKQFRVAANLFLFITSGLVTVLMWQNDGVRDEALMIYPALLVFSVLLGSSRIFWLIFVLVTINILLVGYLNQIGAVYHKVEQGKLSSAITSVIIFTVIAAGIKLVWNDLRSAFRELKAYKEQLEQKVEQRTLELTESQNKLNEAEKMAALGRLVAGLAHEINTPIGVAMTASSHINEQNKKIKSSVAGATLTKPQLENYLEQLDQSAHLVNANLFRAVDLIADFKKVSVLTSNEKKSEFDVIQVIEDTLQTLQPILTENNVDVALQANSTVRLYSDPANLIQTLNNLVLNSLYHGFTGAIEDKKIQLSLHQKQNVLTMLYQDNGVGISDEVKQHIFEPFYTTQRNNGGTGLGMHIVYNMVTQGLGGQIKVGDCEHGAKFEITIPLGD